jgi:hypothetical protein
MSNGVSKPIFPRPTRRWLRYRVWMVLLLPAAIALWLALVPINLTLHVSNQSSAIDPVDIQVEIDGQLVANDHFYFRGGHNWKTFTLPLRPGWHSIHASSAKGESVLQAKVSIFWSRWAALDYWYAPADPTVGRPITPKQFGFYIQNAPIYFQ